MYRVEQPIKFLFLETMCICIDKIHSISLHEEAIVFDFGSHSKKAYYKNPEFALHQYKLMEKLLGYEN